MTAAQPFHRFFREQAPTVARFLAGLVPAADVEECVQDTFLAALRSYERFDGRHPRAWALAIARRKAGDWHRAAARRPPQVASEIDLLAASSEPASDEGLWAEVAGLPDKQRAALVLRFRLDLPHAEIAAALGCSEAAARRSVFEGVGKLRRSRVGEAA